MKVAHESTHPSTEYVLISAPNQAGKNFISQLRQKGIRYYAIVNNRYEKKRLEAMGVTKIIMVDTLDERTWMVPDIAIQKVYLFEDSFNLTCRYIQICRAWKINSIYVVRRRDFNKKNYRALGAHSLIYTNAKEVLLDGVTHYNY